MSQQVEVEQDVGEANSQSLRRFEPEKAKLAETMFGARRPGYDYTRPPTHH